jgi:hypothetical protein
MMKIIEINCINIIQSMYEYYNSFSYTNNQDDNEDHDVRGRLLNGVGNLNEQE